MTRFLALLAVVLMTLGSVPAYANGTDGVADGGCGSDNATNQ